MCDPESWLKPINAPQFHIHRILGLHPKYNAPDECFNEITNIFKQLLETKFFSGIFTGLDNNNNVQGLTNTLKLYNEHECQIPLFLHSREQEAKIINQLDKEALKHIPIIWQNMNLGQVDRFEKKLDDHQRLTVLDFYLKNKNNFFCVNSLINSNELQKLQIFTRGTMLDQLFTATDTPHNVFTPKEQAKPAYSTPIHVIRTLTQLHYKIINYRNYEHFQLYDTCDYFFSKAIDLFPNKPPISATAYTLKARPIIEPFVKKWNKNIKYEQPIFTKSYDSTPSTVSKKRSKVLEPESNTDTNLLNNTKHEIKHYIEANTQTDSLETTTIETQTETLKDQDTLDIYQTKPQSKPVTITDEIKNKENNETTTKKRPNLDCELLSPSKNKRKPLTKDNNLNNWLNKTPNIQSRHSTQTIEGHIDVDMAWFDEDLNNENISQII